MNSEAREFSVYKLNSLPVGQRRFPFGFKKPQIFGPAFVANKSGPSITIFPLVHALCAATIGGIAFLVGGVLASGSFAQVIPAVITGVAVFVIDFALGPTSIFQQKDQAVPHVHVAVDADQNISVIAAATGCFSDFTSRRSVDAPSEQSRISIVSQKASSVFRAKLADSARSWFSAGSHSTLLKSLWLEASESVAKRSPVSFYRTRSFSWQV